MERSANNPFEAMLTLPDSVKRIAMLGGGALRSVYDGTPVRDYDLFFRSVQDFDDAAVDMSGYCEFVSKGALADATFPTFRDPDGRLWNLIGFHFSPSIEQLALSFDLLPVSMAMELKEIGGSWVPEFAARHQAIEAARARILAISRPQSRERLQKRVDRYVREYDYLMTEEVDIALRTGMYRGEPLPAQSEHGYL